MGERKGQNFYYPPDFDPKKHGNLNRYHGTHALRERAAKIGQGILIIRFEMPFNIWCFGCERHVAMGVRYNSEKKKVGMYLSTPIYEFKMRCHLCENYFIIRTDPKNFDYELVEGCRRQEKRWDPSENQGFAPKDQRKEAQKLAADAMFKLEHGEKDKDKLKAAAPQIEELEFLQSRTRDDFGANQALRKIFRTKKNELKVQANVDSDLRKRSSLEIELVPETEGDKKLASMLARYRTVQTVEEKQEEAREEIASRSIFSKRTKQGNTNTPSTSSSSSADSNPPSSPALNPTTKKDKLEKLRKSLSLSVYRKRLANSDHSTLDSKPTSVDSFDEATTSEISTTTTSTAVSSKGGKRKSTSLVVVGREKVSKPTFPTCNIVDDTTDSASGVNNSVSLTTTKPSLTMSECEEPSSDHSVVSPSEAKSGLASLGDYGSDSSSNHSEDN